MRDLRHLPRAGSLVEITNKTIQDRYLFRPSERLNRRLAGVLAKAQDVTGMCVHAAVFMSNHYHLLVSPMTVQQMARFMNHLGTNISKEVKRIHQWTGPVFAHRYHAIPVSDEEPAQVARLIYLLSQGVKEDLVMAPEEWPGLQTIAAMTRGEPIRGTWVDRTRMWVGGKGKRKLDERDFRQELCLELSPLPCWAHFTPRAYCSRIRELVEKIERDTIERHRRQRTAPIGVRSVLRQHPHHAPTPGARTSRPRFHALRRSVRKALEDGYRSFVVAYREAAERLELTPNLINFPENCFPPRLPFVHPVQLLEPG